MVSTPSNIEMPAPELETWLRLKDVRGVTKLSTATIYRRMKAGTFPRSYALSDGIVFWRERDIAEWQAQVLQEAAQ